MSITIREIVKPEYPLLEDFLYHAIFIPPGVEMQPRDVIFKPEIYIYVKDFGGKDDCGVVAESDGKITGAAWTRIIPAFGHIDDKTPELAISVLPEHRGQGIGTMLMKRLLDLLLERGYRRTSLSVQKENQVVRFYERLGYKITCEKLDNAGHCDYIMVKDLKSDLTQIPGIGKKMAEHLIRTGYPTIESLKGQVPEEIYAKHCSLQGAGNQSCKCVLYCYRLAVSYADHDGQLPPDKQNWGDWKD